MSNILNYCFALFLVGFSLVSVSCQTKQDNIDSVLKPCRELLAKDDHLAAGKCYEKVILAHPKQLDELSETFENDFFKKCVEYKKKKNYQSAIVCFEGMTVLTPENAFPYFQLADSYFQYDKLKGYSKSGDFNFLARAEEQIKKGLEIKPDAAAYGLYGEILEAKNDWQGAVVKYQQAIKLNDKVLAYWLSLALVQEKTDDSTGALESYKNALKINPDDTDVLYFLELFYEKNERFDDALETLNRRLKIESATKEDLQKLKQLKDKQKKAKVVGSS